MKNTIYFFVLLCLSGPLAAHQLQEAMSTIYFNERSGNLEVMHRFYVHDAEHVMKSIDSEHYDIIASEQAQSIFALYVVERFAIRFNKNDELGLQLLGQEFDGKYIWVYQESPLPEFYQSKKPFSISVKHTSLQEFWPEQKNIVNIEHRGAVSSMLLDKENEWLSKNLNAESEQK